jgi:hypothetical protein
VVVAVFCVGSSKVVGWGPAEAKELVSWVRGPHMLAEVL